MSEVINPEDIKERVGDSIPENEIEELIDEYMEIGDEEKPDDEELKKIIEKEREKDKMRVSAFKLSEDQYDSILEHLKEIDEYSVDESSSGGELVRYALKEFIEMVD
jgi:hypothetical protein